MTERSISGEIASEEDTSGVCLCEGGGSGGGGGGTGGAGETAFGVTGGTGAGFGTRVASRTAFVACF
jgi:hypothetical protein